MLFDPIRGAITFHIYLLVFFFYIFYIYVRLLYIIKIDILFSSPIYLKLKSLQIAYRRRRKTFIFLTKHLQHIRLNRPSKFDKSIPKWEEHNFNLIMQKKKQELIEHFRLFRFHFLFNNRSEFSSINIWWKNFFIDSPICWMISLG